MLHFLEGNFFCSWYFFSSKIIFKNQMVAIKLHLINCWPTKGLLGFIWSWTVFFLILPIIILLLKTSFMSFFYIHLKVNIHGGSRLSSNPLIPVISSERFTKTKAYTSIPLKWKLGLINLLLTFSRILKFFYSLSQCYYEKFAYLLTDMNSGQMFSVVSLNDLA